MSNQAFLVDPGALANAAPGQTVTLDGPEGHHAVSVKRVREGERIDLVDGGGRRAACVVVTTAKGFLEARVETLEVEPSPALRTVLVQALAKGDRDLQAVESAVELGIDRVVPWQAERCVVRWTPDKAARGRQKWESTVRAAVKQSRRSREPSVGEPVNTNQLAAMARTHGTQGTGGGTEVPGGRLTVVLHETATEPLSRVVQMRLAQGKPPVEILLVVGPEGGIAPGELDKLVSAGAATASLGTNVLRASTAGPAALVLVRHLAGLLDGSVRN